MFKQTLFILSLLTVSLADTINFTNGAVLKGDITQENSQTVTIDIEGKKSTYLQSDIKNIELSVKVSPPPAVALPPTVTTKTPLIAEVGSILHVVSISQLSTQQHKKGHQFKIRLETPLLSKDKRVVAPEGSDLYGVVVYSKQAGRIVGTSEMVVTLNTIVINEKRVAITTNNLNILSGSGEGRDTAKKTLRGAAIGGLINGSDGAKDGAKVGVGLAILTRGKPTGLSSGKLLDFRLTSKLEVE